MTDLLIEFRAYITAAHIFGITMGLGGAIITDFLFMRFLKDFKVSNEEKEVLDGLSIIIWSGLAILIVTGLALFWPYQSALLAAPLFQMKMLVVAVILINGVILNYYVTPKLTSITFDQPSLNAPAVNRVRAFSPIFGGISIISWTFTFFLGAMGRHLDVMFLELLGIYAGLLIMGIIVTIGVTKYKFRPKKIN